jgi:hypothetical protein
MCPSAVRGLSLALLVFAGCRQASVKQVEPELGLGAPALDFGVRKVGVEATASVELLARTQADVTLAAALSGDADFVVSPPSSLAGLEVRPLTVRFTPARTGPRTAVLTLTSNDPRNPTQTLTFTGTGAEPQLEVTAGCDAGASCTAVVTATPLAIDFGEEPLLRRLPLETAALPFVTVRNTGQVPATLGATVSGPHALAFTQVTPLPTELAPGAQATLPLRFVPPQQASTPFTATLEVTSDAPAARTTRVALSGRARPNLPPRVCLNLSEVQPPGGLPVSYGAEADWAPLRALPAGGYDFTMTRPIPPRAVITLSAHSPGPAQACTSDPEDGRILLTYQWTNVSWPAGAPPPALAGDQGPLLRLAAVATGDYVVRLEVRDAQGNASSTTARFRVEVRNDLVVQLSWSGDGGNQGADLDLHLVRPGGAPFGARTLAGAVVSDDVSGFTVSGALLDAGLSLDWGLPGSADDPRLNVDDSGDGPLVENVSLDGPANGCTSSPCRYGVFVHAFRDARALPMAPTCAVSGCLDGEACGCAGDARCVADAAPRDGGVTGAGHCRPAVDVEVRVFVRGAPVATLPVSPDVLRLSSPCHLVHVADVDWPTAASDAGVVVRPASTPAPRRFGWRPPGPAPSLACTPNTRLTLPAGQSPWFSEEPR